MNRLVSSMQRVSAFLRSCVSPILRIWECRYVGAVSALDAHELQPIFIIGAPRTGSTILYQAITNAYQVSYIDNTAARWFRNLRFGMWLSHRRYGDSAHDNFDARHGDTTQYGGHAPSECGEFWYRWLPRDRHFIDESDVSEKMIHEIRNEVFGVTRMFQRPLLFKNLNAGQRLRLIRQAFPGARLVFIRRDPRFVIRSLLRARKKLGVAPHSWWSIMPRNVSDLLPLSEPEMCAAQVYYLEQQIIEDLAMFPKDQVFEVHYQQLDIDSVSALASSLGLKPRKDLGFPKFSADDAASLSPADRDMLEQVAGQYDFAQELFV